MPKNYSKKGSYYTYDRKPSSRTEKRIVVPQIEKRPVRFQARSLIRQELIQKDPYWFVLHRRGLSREEVGEDPLEARAMPHSMIRGTLPERIIYKSLVQEFHLVPEVDFNFQCVAGHHKVLKADMTWIPVSELKVGDKLLSFEEFGSPNRAWTTGTVIHNEPGIEETYKVHLSNGDIITCTPEHPWLIHYSQGKKDWSEGTGYSWMRTDQLKVGAYIPKFLDKWETDKSYEAGWLAGFFDGEGSVIHGKTQSGGHAITLTISQNAGEMFDTMLNYLNKTGFEFSVYDYRDKHTRSYDDGKRQIMHCRIKGGRAEALKFLGTIRPSKLKRLCIEKLGKLTKLENVRVTKIEYAERQLIYRLGVDVKTYLVDGYGMHNTSLQGGRIDTGGIIADFIFPYLRMVINPTGPTHSEYIRMWKDDEQTMALAEMGYEQFLIPEEKVYDEYYLSNWLRRRLGWMHGGGNNSQNDFDDVETNPGFINDKIMTSLMEISDYIHTGLF